MSDCKGTMIDNLGDLEAATVITGITHQSDRIQVSINLDDNINNKAVYKSILAILADNEISLDLINIFPKEKVFTIGEDKKVLFESIMNEHNIKFELIDNLSKIAVVGTKMRGIPGVIAKIVEALDDKDIEVLQSADSHMTIWCLVETNKVKDAIKALHQAFL